ncbi:KIN17-like protein [Vanrija pseudolonga]|uniref:KIN17-like protein n=1 Tax=Vanrija pseudolonga TaxID=143232 RepID=A0AAF0Y5N8_9TREE|nr:KIN17-like protein [Vanrija pseudolonga]
MGRAEGGSTKAIANAIKAKGLGRLRWYCQICEKQMRDENGFQAHCRSEPHLRKIIAVGPKAGATIAEFSRQFQYEFLSLLKSRHNTQRVRANAVYNEYIQDKEHVHMNATRWVTLSGFVGTLGKAGIVKVDEDDKGLWIQWIDNTPKTLQKQAALQKMERATMDGEERERKMLEDQIARARAAVGADDNQPEQGLQKVEGEKITLSFSKAEPGESSGAASTSAGDKPKISFGTIGTSLGAAPAAGAAPANPLKIGNPLKRAAPTNVFKTAKSAKTEPKEESSKPKAFMSEAERLMKEDLARKAARGGGGGGGGYTGAGPRRGGPVRR